MTPPNELQGFLDQFMTEQNNRQVPEFEGYSPNEMQYILHDTFGGKSPIKLRKLNGDDYKKIPILNQIKYLAEIISRTGDVKLQTGISANKGCEGII